MEEGFDRHGLEGVICGYVLEDLGRGQGCSILYITISRRPD